MMAQILCSMLDTRRRHLSLGAKVLGSPFDAGLPEGSKRGRDGKMVRWLVLVGQMLQVGVHGRKAFHSGDLRYKRTASRY